MKTAKQTITELLKEAGISINGNQAYDIQINNERFYNRVLAEGVLGLGESYMDGDWDCKALDEMFFKALRAGLESKIEPLKIIFPLVRAWLINRQRKSKAFKVGKHHYDIGNDLFTSMLDKRMTYSCGYWKNVDNLDAAQEAKLDLICRKICLKPNLRVLDIGCGWGSFAGYAAEKYGVSVLGITVSQEQIELAQERYKGLDIEFRYQDYREVNEPFDRIVSVGMFEHVGPKNYQTFMQVTDRCLVDNGYFLLHTIGSNTSRTSTDPWTDKYIFPGGVPPSPYKLMKSIEGIFVLRDWHSFGGDYDRTLMAWYENFNNAWSDLITNYDARFYRMWRFFLLSAAAGFRSNRNQLWQIVLSKKAASADYNAVR
jgi:cyclopropane-fatty-acyl-phospholipid synthase